MGKSNFLQDFKAFAMKGNVVDMAVGVIIGGAFGKIVSSLVADIIMPPLGLLIGGVNFTDLAWTMKDAVVVDGVEQAAAVLVLEGMDVLGHRRLGQIQGTCGSPGVHGIIELEKGLELVVHHGDHLLSFIINRF